MPRCVTFTLTVEYEWWSARAGLAVVVMLLLLVCQTKDHLSVKTQMLYTASGGTGVICQSVMTQT